MEDSLQLITSYNSIACPIEDDQFWMILDIVTDNHL